MRTTPRMMNDFGDFFNMLFEVNHMVHVDDFYYVYNHPAMFRTEDDPYVSGDYELFYAIRYNDASESYDIERYAIGTGRQNEYMPAIEIKHMATTERVSEAEQFLASYLTLRKLVALPEDIEGLTRNVA